MIRLHQKVHKTKYIVVETKFLQLINKKHSLSDIIDASLSPLGLKLKEQYSYDTQSATLYVTHHLYENFQSPNCFGKIPGFYGFNSDDLKKFLKDMFEKHLGYNIKNVVLEEYYNVYYEKMLF